MLDLLTILSDQKEELQNTDVSLLITRREESLFNLKSKRAQVVIGVRRCGKSTICKKVLIESNINFAYVNFDDERLIHLKIDEMNSVMETLYRIYGDFDCLLLDEIQNVEGWLLHKNAGRFLVGITTIFQFHFFHQESILKFECKDRNKC